MTLVAGVIIGILVALVYGLAAHRPLVVREVQRTDRVVRAERTDVSRVADKALDSVVSVRSEGGQIEVSGTGFVIDQAGGWVLTNAHVALIPSSADGADSPGQAQGRLRPAEGIYVEFDSSHTIAQARLVGYDLVRDVALLQVEVPKDAGELQLAQSSKVRAGDQVIAIGSPFDQVGSVSSGIISATSRSIPALVGSSSSTGVLQTDAAINQGNSGGPVLDMRGQVVGMATQINSEGSGSSGVAYAVASDDLADLLPRLREGEVKHAWLGVSATRVTQQLAKELSLPIKSGAMVQRVDDGSPAQHAGVRASSRPIVWFGDRLMVGGDIITKVDDQQVSSPEDLVKLVDDYSPGSKVKLTVIRAGKSQSVSVTLSQQ